MILSRGPLMRLFIALWCVIGMYTLNADGLLVSQHYAEAVIQCVDDIPAIDTGTQTGTAEIRVPHISAAAAALRDPISYAKQTTRPIKRTAKPRRLSHFEYCSRDMVRSIMLQFHPREIQ